MKLYKYVTARRLDILQNEVVRFTQPSAFNDPFEIANTVDGVFGAQTNPLEGVLGKSELGRIMMDAMNLGTGHVLKQYFSTMFGVISLTEKPDNLLMWAHYADDHQGFVIELDSEHEFFDRRESDEDPLRHLRKIEYSSTRPVVPLAKYNAVDGLLVKSLDWEYEQEWRMVMPLKESNQKIEQEGFPVHLYDLPASSITGIILGCRIQEDDRERILDFLASDARYGHVIVSRATLDPRAFRLELSESPEIYLKRVAISTEERDLDAALKHANTALELAQDSEKGIYYGIRGMVYAARKDTEAALRDFEELKKLDPERYQRMFAGMSEAES
jgi:tetratricopeptide (TPR) repeat protein